HDVRHGRAYVRYGLENDGANPRLLAVVAVECFELHILARIPFCDAIGANTDEVARPVGGVDEALAIVDEAIFETMGREQEEIACRQPPCANVEALPADNNRLIIHRLDRIDLDPGRALPTPRVR